MASNGVEQGGLILQTPAAQGGVVDGAHCGFLCVEVNVVDPGDGWGQRIERETQRKRENCGGKAVD